MQMMARQLELAAAGFALLSTIATGSVVVENRYAKAVDVQQELSVFWIRTLKLRILELELKPADSFTNADRVMLRNLKQELREATGVSSDAL